MKAHGRVAAAPPQLRGARRSGALRVRCAAASDRRSRDLDDDGVRAHPQYDHARSRRSARASCRSSPTNRARSAWRACSASSGIYSSVGQLYHPQDAEQLMWYREDKHGQILQEGINEAGAISSWIAAGHLVLQSRSADDSVLHLLFDVRLPAHRRSRVGGGRQPHARVLARRNVGPHDAQRRRACSTKTAAAKSWLRSFPTAAATIRPTPTRSR